MHKQSFTSHQINKKNVTQINESMLRLHHNIISIQVIFSYEKVIYNLFLPSINNSIIMSKCQHGSKITQFCITQSCTWKQSAACQSCMKKYHNHVGKSKVITESQLISYLEKINFSQRTKPYCKNLKQSFFNYLTNLKETIDIAFDNYCRNLMIKIGYPVIGQTQFLGTYRKLKTQSYNKISKKDLAELLTYIEKLDLIQANQKQNKFYHENVEKAVIQIQQLNDKCRQLMKVFNVYVADLNTIQKNYNRIITHNKSRKVTMAIAQGNISQKKQSGSYNADQQTPKFSFGTPQSIQMRKLNNFSSFQAYNSVFLNSTPIIDKKNNQVMMSQSTTISKQKQLKQNAKYNHKRHWTDGKITNPSNNLQMDDSMKNYNEKQKQIAQRKIMLESLLNGYKKNSKQKVPSVNYGKINSFQPANQIDDTKNISHNSQKIKKTDKNILDLQIPNIKPVQRKKNQFIKSISLQGTLFQKFKSNSNQQIQNKKCEQNMTAKKVDATIVKDNLNIIIKQQRQLSISKQLDNTQSPPKVNILYNNKLQEVQIQQKIQTANQQIHNFQRNNDLGKNSEGFNIFASLLGGDIHKKQKRVKKNSIQVPGDSLAQFQEEKSLSSEKYDQNFFAKLLIEGLDIAKLLLIPIEDEKQSKYQNMEQVKKKTIKIALNSIPQTEEQIQSPLLKKRRQNKKNKEQIFQLEEVVSQKIQEEKVQIKDNQANSVFLLTKALSLPPQQAIPLLEKSLQYSQDNISAAEYLTYLYLQKGQARQCLKICNKMEQKFKNSSADQQFSYHIKNNKAASLNMLGRYSQSIMLLQQCLNKFKTDNIYKNLGDAYFGIGIYEKSIYAYEDALRLNKNYDEANFNLAVCYYTLNNFNSALCEVKKALSIDPKNNEYKMLLTDLVKKLKDFE